MIIGREVFWVKAISLLLLVGAVYFYNQYMGLYLETAALAEASSSDFAGLPDGEYQGSGMGFGGMVTVRAKVMDGKLEMVGITEAAGEDGAYLESAQNVINQMVERQTVEVDVVSGATFSSQGIIDAVKTAVSIEKERNGQE